MKVKGIIWKHDGTNDYAIPKSKDIQAKKFTFEGNTYFTHAERHQTTNQRLWGFLWRRYYTTFYYVEGCPNPLPVPQIVAAMTSDRKKIVRLSSESNLKVENLESVSVDENQNQVSTPVDPEAADVPDDIKKREISLVNVGASGPELSGIFNGFLWRILGPKTTGMFEHITFLLILSSAICSAYLLLDQLGVFSK